MKLIFAIVNKDDSSLVCSELNKAGFSATKFSSTGGFLRAGNTTFMICSEGKNVDLIIDIIAKFSKSRTQISPAVLPHGISGYSTNTVEIPIGGATVFVTNIERFEKI